MPVLYLSIYQHGVHESIRDRVCALSCLQEQSHMLKFNTFDIDIVNQIQIQGSKDKTLQFPPTTRTRDNKLNNLCSLVREDRWFEKKSKEGHLRQSRRTHTYNAVLSFLPQRINNHPHLDSCDFNNRCPHLTSGDLNYCGNSRHTNQEQRPLGDS